MEQIHFRHQNKKEEFVAPIQIRSNKKDRNGEYIWTGDKVKHFCINEDDSVNLGQFDICEIGWKDDQIVIDDSYHKNWSSFSPLSEMKSEWMELVK